MKCAMNYQLISHIAGSNDVKNMVVSVYIYFSYVQSNILFL